MDSKRHFLRVVTLIVIIFECNSVNHNFCNDLNLISNAYSFGHFVYITQGMQTIWRFDMNSLQVSKEQQSIGSIFGTGIGKTK